MNPLYATDFAVWLWTILLRGANAQAYKAGSETGINHRRSGAGRPRQRQSSSAG